MARTRDRTDDFREAVCTIAMKQGFNEVKMAKVRDSLIPQTSQQKSPFTQAALNTLESIRTLQIFVVNHKKDYMATHRTMDQDWDGIEHEVGVLVEECRAQIEILKNRIESIERKGLLNIFYKKIGVIVKACKEQIEILKNSIESKERKGPQNTYYEKGDGVNADLIAHKHGVVLILSEHLQSITILLDQLRAARYRKVIDRTIPRRMWHTQSKLKSLEAPISNDPKDIEVFQQNAQAGTKGIQKQLLDDETQALQVELTNRLGITQEMEIKMLAISALNNVFSIQVLHQTQQMKHLYEQAIEATENIEKGNKELTKAVERRSSRTFLLPLLFVVVLIVTILFLDWYQ